jgi:hypothetical protein
MHAVPGPSRMWFTIELESTAVGITHLFCMSSTRTYSNTMVQYAGNLPTAFTTAALQMYEYDCIQLYILVCMQIPAAMPAAAFWTADMTRKLAGGWNLHASGFGYSISCSVEDYWRMERATCTASGVICATRLRACNTHIMPTTCL